MQNFLIVVDMQKDFIDGALGSEHAKAIVPAVKKRIEDALNGGEIVIFTRDTHTEDYLSTQEGEKLPVPHCIKGTDGWQIDKELKPYATKCMIIDKPTFGSTELATLLKNANDLEPVEGVTLLGLCTDICVISNAMLVKATLPETKVKVDASCSAGVTNESHKTALNAMRACQIEILND
jgi:nicotinamidase-related amidase